MTELNKSENISTQHPHDEELIRYFNGTLPEAAHETIQAHLVDCNLCLETFADVRDFYELHRRGEQMINEDLDRQWRLFADRISEVPRPLTPALEGSQKSRRSTATLFALAAMLLVILALGAWVIRQRRHNQRLAAELEVARRQTTQLQADHDSLSTRLMGLEQENSALRNRGLPVEKSQSSRGTNIKKPELNAPIYDLYARNFTQRSGNQAEVNRIKVPSSAESIILILNGEGLALSSSYGVEILGESGRVLWRTGGLKRGQLGNFTLTIHQSFLSKGTYRLRLYSQENWSSKPLTEYLMRIE